jgi:hypothetical protein
MVQVRDYSGRFFCYCWSSYNFFWHEFRTTLLCNIFMVPWRSNYKFVRALFGLDKFFGCWLPPLHPVYWKSQMFPLIYYCWSKYFLFKHSICLGCKLELVFFDYSILLLPERCQRRESFHGNWSGQPIIMVRNGLRIIWVDMKRI